MLARGLRTRDDPSIILVRLLVGLVVFLPRRHSLLFPALLGAGRFHSSGIPWPEFLGPFVGVAGILCGALLFPGLLTRLATSPLIIIMIVAIVSAS